MKIRVALLTASVAPYAAPLYRTVANDPHVDFTAIVATSGGVGQYDPAYQRAIVWDTDLLAGYRSRFLKHAAKNQLGGSEVQASGTRAICMLRDIDVIPEILKGRYDVLWVNGYVYMTYLMAIAAQRARGGAVLIREEQTLLHPRPPWKTAAKEASLRLLFSQCAGLYIGTQNRRWFEHYGMPRERLFFTPYCVDNDRWQASAAALACQRDRLRREFGIGTDAGPVILSVSRLIPKKQPLLLLEAFKRLRARRRCALLIVGSGEMESAVRQKVAEEQIPDVAFAGFLNQSEVSRAYACADVFTLFSREHETWGLVVNEAMNFGLPVVVSDKVGAASDLVRDGHNGFVVSARDPAELTERLALLVDAPDMRERFGTASREIVESWNVEAASAGVLRAVARAVGPRQWKEAVEDVKGDGQRA